MARSQPGLKIRSCSPASDTDISHTACRLRPGKYTLRLLFAETFFGPTNRGKGGVGSRVFNVYCSGLGILKQFDIFKEAGENRAVEKVFHGITPNAQGRIDLTFEPVVNYAIVQAIELTPEDSGGRSAAVTVNPSGSD